MTIAGGTIENRTTQSIYNEGEFLIIGGTVSSSGTWGYGIYNANSGNVTVEGGTISATQTWSYGIYNSGNGSILIEEGVINSGEYGIYNASTGNITVEGGTIDSDYGVYNASIGTVKILKGTIISTYYGIHNASTGDIIIGTKEDGIVSQEEPYIKGENTGTYNGYGIYNTKGKLYFYDGIIEGKTKAVYDIITEREENTELNYNEDKIERLFGKNKSDEEVISEAVKLTNLSKDELVGNNQVSDWASGDFVIHDTFGKGVVVKVNDRTLDIAFELPAGLKTLMSNHKALKKLTN